LARVYIMEESAMGSFLSALESRSLFGQMPPLNEYEAALVEAWGVDGGAVLAAVNRWTAFLVVGTTDANIEQVRKSVLRVVASNGRRRTSALNMLVECEESLDSMGLL